MKLNRFELRIQKQITDYLYKVLSPIIGTENIVWFCNNNNKYYYIYNLLVMIKIQQGQSKVIINYFIKIESERIFCNKYEQDEREQFNKWVNDNNCWRTSQHFIVTSLDDCLEQTDYFGFVKELEK
jgi:hypothetical protein